MSEYNGFVFENNIFLLGNNVCCFELCEQVEKYFVGGLYGGEFGLMQFVVIVKYIVILVKYEVGKLVVVQL